MPKNLKKDLLLLVENIDRIRKKEHKNKNYWIGFADCALWIIDFIEIEKRMDKKKK